MNYQLLLSNRPLYSVVLVFLCQALQLAITTQKGWRVLVLGFTKPELMVRQSPLIGAVAGLNGVGAYCYITLVQISILGYSTPLSRAPCSRILRMVWILPFSNSGLVLRKHRRIRSIGSRHGCVRTIPVVILLVRRFFALCSAIFSLHPFSISSACCSLPLPSPYPFLYVPDR